MNIPNGSRLLSLRVPIFAVFCVICIALAAIMAIPAYNNRSRVEEEPWPSFGMAALLPKPAEGITHDIRETDGDFSADVEKVTEIEFDSYVEACKEKGFDEEANNNSRSYTAYNADGYYLDLSMIGESYSISLKSPIAGTFEWPTNGPAALLPAPQQTTGEIAVNSSSQLTAHITNMQPESFNSYIDQCVARGFSVDYSRNDRHYNADDASGNSLYISYEGMGNVTLSLYIEDSSPNESLGSEQGGPSSFDMSNGLLTDADSDSTAGGVDVAFKEMMDSYEAFFNEYVEFMKTFDEASATPEIMLAFADYTARYSDYVNKMEEVDETTLSEADLTYYLEVQARINQKLAELA